MRLFFSLIGSLLMLTGFALAHPAEEITANDYPGYNSILGDSDWVAGEIKFYSLEDRETYEQLSPLELYMLAGGKDPGSGGEIGSWYMRVLSEVRAYQMKFGNIPDSLTYQAMDSLDDTWTYPQDEFEWLKNPLSNNPVKLRSTAFSQGDMYVSVLTQEDKILLSYLSPVFKQKFGLNLDTGPGHPGEIGPTDEIDGPVLYWRMYGRTGVLAAGLYYARPSN